MGSSREVVLAQFLADLGVLDGREIDVILDDYHLVGRSPDVRMIVSRLLERAPHGIRLILAGRGRPNLALGRLLSQGRVAELTIDDLRFTKAEIEQLFAGTYQQPLAPDDCAVIAERTEGWAASLQLVSASIAVSRPSEVGAFIKALNGATGPIYDFLAEEVLARLSGQTQRVLIHASLIDRVKPELVAAALSVAADVPPMDVVRKALAEAETLGLLGAGGGSRIHPLFRQFLEYHLRLEVPPDVLRSMHVAIAQAAETEDWLIAAKHYALGSVPDQAMRVLGSAASEALGTGAWGAAVEIVELMPDTNAPPSVEVIRARALVSEGRSTPGCVSTGDGNLQSGSCEQ
jgi:LuxR family maltose regulon positive regulatory protein